MSQSTRRAVSWDAPRALRLALVALGALALVLAVIVRINAPLTPARSIVGDVAPSFALPAEVNGARLPNLVQPPLQSGHSLLLVFAYSLCPRCLGELQTSRDLQSREANRGLGVVYLDSPAETPAIANAYFQRLGITAPVLLDSNGTVAARYGVQYYPAAVLIDAHGVVRLVATGETSAQTLTSAINRLITPAD